MESTTIMDVPSSNTTNLTVDDDASKYFYLRNARYSTVALFSTSLYLCLVLLVYEIRTASIKRATVNHLVLFSAVNALISCTSQLLELFVGLHCSLYRWVNAITLVLGIAIVYTVIWARQRKFYRDPLLKKTVSKPVRWVSKWILVGIYGALGSLIPTFVLTYNFILSEYGCIVVWSDGRIRGIVLPLLFCIFIGNTFIQFSLLGLVVYPLCVTVPQSTESPKNKKQLIKRRSFEVNMQSDIRQVVTRLSTATLVCVLSTLVSNIFVVMSVQSILEAFWSNFIVCDLLVNIIACVCSFVNWKERLFPLCFPLRIKSQNDNNNHLTSVTVVAS